MSSTYTKDVVYPSSFYGFQAPIHLAAMAGVVGQPSNFDTSGFTYGDFGCGTGETLNVLAASYPQAFFYGFDINPEHIRIAKDTAEQGGVENVRFIECDFRTLPSEEIPKLSYASAVGVYSWLNSEQRQELLEVVSDRLADGGLFLLHYSCLPGNAQIRMISKIANLFATHLDGDNLTKAEQALEATAAIVRSAPQFNEANPTALKLIEMQQQLDIRYVAHDMFNADKQETWFEDVFEDCRKNGLQFLASADPRRITFEDLAPPSLSEAFRRVASDANDVVIREEAQNFLINEPMRNDIFVKAEDSKNPTKDDLAMSGLFCFGVRHNNYQALLKNFQKTVTVDLSSPIYERMLTMTAVKPVAIERLCEDLAASWNPQEVRRAIRNLLGFQLLVLCTNDDEFDRPTRQINPARLDKYLLSERLEDQQDVGFPSQFLGNGITLSRMDRLVLAGMAFENEEAVWKLLQDKNVNLKLGPNDSVQSLDQFKQLLAAGTAQFKQTKLPELLRRGLMAQS